MQWALGISLGAFFALMVVISLWSRSRIHSGEDFIVAGRRLSPLLTTATIMATWYAAETILVTADAVRDRGLRVTALEPIGIACCLLMGGLFYAQPLRDSRHLTLADVIGARFGAFAERLQALLSLSYVGWVAVQLVGLAGVFQVFFGLPLPWGIALTALVLTSYTLIGGMWSVALTDLVQLALLLVGIVALTWTVLNELGPGPVAGLMAIADRAQPADLVLVPTESFSELRTWIGLIVVGMFGNLASSDLVQRMFSARSGRVAASSCLWAGGLYLLFGSLPVILGLAGGLLLDPAAGAAVIPALAEAFFTAPMAILFALTLTAAVTSSVDSGLLAPASTLARNVLVPLTRGRVDLLPLTRLCVIGVALASTSLALSGTRAFELLQGTYALGIPAFVLLTFALFQRHTIALPGIVTLSAGVALWLYEMVSTALSADAAGRVFSPAFPAVLLVFSFAVYLLSDRLARALGQHSRPRD